MIAKNIDQTPVSMGEGITRKVLSHSANLMVVEVTLEAGSIVPNHKHIHEQCSYVVSGKILYTVEGEPSVELITGDSILVAGDVNHTITTLEKSIVLDAFNPPREDFLA